MAPHFLLIPLPEQGHSAPMLSLASHLAALGCTVTFLTAQKAPLATPSPARPQQHGAHTATPSPSPSPSPSADSPVITNGTSAIVVPFARDLHFLTLPYTGEPSLLTEASRRFDILKETLAGLIQRQGIVEKIVHDSKSSAAPMACIICDILLCSWVMPLAKRQSVLSAALVPCSLTNFYLSYLKKKGKSEEGERVRRSLEMPGSSKAALMTEEQQKQFAEVSRVFFGAFNEIEMSSHVLVNSCRSLDMEVLDVLSASELNFRFIGPLFPAWEVGADAERYAMVGNSIARKAGCPYAEDKTCLPWLDRQEKGSVLLVAFGSEVTPDPEQVQELAMGIEASGCKFLWVVRPNAHMPPKDFLDRMCNVGMCISWGPQRAVLQHAAVGGFLTHCGWNSTVESVLAGVPMLCLPLNGDQFLNSHIIQVVWKVGLPLVPRNTLVSRVEVERSIRELMSSEELRRRIGQLQEVVHGSLPESESSISSFVQDIVFHQASK